ncbi:tpr and ankyrin repeat-containing protein 1, partial [Phtheirospermum japonicum]
VEDIPKSFESVDRYLGSFVYPLLEETRAELASAMETVYKAPFAEITSFTSFKGQTLFYDVKVDHWRNRQSDRGSDAYRTLPGDIVLVSNMKPETASDLERAGWAFTFACVRKISEDEHGDDGCTPCNFRVRTAALIEAGDRQSETLYVVFLMNVTTQKRIWDALGMRENLRIIEKVISKDDLGEENCALCPLMYNSKIEEELESTFSSKVNESQLEAISASLSKINCYHKPSVELIWGPPGTGKTTTVSILLYTLLRMNVRTLICAPTNVAIKELASRLIALVRNSVKTESGNGFLPCPLGEILIFGNKDRLKVGSDIEEVYLDYRVDRLVECLASFTGWKHCIASMLNFLEDCVSQYQIFVENEQMQVDVEKSESGSLLKFARDRFSHLAPPLRECMSTFLTHLPRSFVREQTFKNIMQLMLHLDAMETLLFEDNGSMTCDELESVFLRKAITIGSEPFVDTSSLLCVRVSLDGLDLPTLPIVTDKALTTELCFQKASLIFCTTSSSFKLHSVDMEPFSLLVIDEAAQVKESESIIALQIPNVRHAILVGDEKQLPSIVNSKLSEGAGFGRSLFERLSSLGHSKHLLNVQYRMHPSISLFPNSSFYLNQILDSPLVLSQSYERRFLQGRMFGPYSFINVRAWDGSNENLSIGLISPYAAQVVAIRDRLHNKYENNKGFIVKVKSVDGFQGGNERTLSKSDSVWEALISDAKRRQCFFNGDEDNDIGKTIIDVKNELEQLDDLLCGESILFKNSRWKVLFSDNFRKSFQKLKPSNVKKLVINVLLKLSSGWRPKKVNVDWTCESSPYIVKQFKVEKYYIVCSVDVIKDSIYVQVLKIWDIMPMAETPKLLKRLDGIFATYTDDFINLCNAKLLEGNLEVPKSWSASNDIIRFKNSNNTANSSTTESGGAVDCRSYVENSKVNESLLLMKFYSLSSGTVNHLLTDLEGREVDLPFEVTDEEREIIMFSRSSFILGRSGTGKTTILTMKLFQKFQQYTIASGDSMETDNKVDFSEYIFVTVSPKLCYAVKKHVSQLQSFASGNYIGNKFADTDDIDEMAEFRDIPDTFVGIELEKYPLVITFHKFLMMLDGTLGNSYFERFRDVRGSTQIEGRRSVALTTFIRRNEVTYDRFRSFYWPHFNAKLTKNLDPSRVFTEIMSHIKGGGPQDGETCDSKRTRIDYISLSDSRVSTLSAEKREVIYDMFEDYEKMKLERGEFDLADFVNDIQFRLENENLMGDKMDFVYIDEVQDLTMSQISLFKYICKNVDEGFVFCGDTAQTIARGIDFRFEDIRSLFYNEFLMKNRNCEVQGRGEKGLISDTFCLSQNFRTHTGVLRLSQSVIDVICHFFPQSIDVLPPETSLIYGESPVVLEPGSDENLIMTIFGHSGKAGGKWVGFGADQVILVRDDSARKEVSNCIGHQALVLTIVECKGLEFQDVLLYNFFGSSPLSNQWRVVYEFLKEKDLLDADSPSFPTFSQSKHNILCSELKQLYVAITRTRQRLWICENNEELSKPMLDYWKRLCLVQVRKIDDSLAEAMQRASSPEEWKSQGIKLFWEKNYEMATLCFEKAGDETWEKRAKASGLRSSADTLRVSNPEEARVMLREAAEIFDSIGRADSAAECFCDLGEYERAGNIYLKCGTSELRKAGECFSLAGSYRIAAEVYAKGNFFNECLSSCTKGNYFDLSLQYIEQWKQLASQSSGDMTKFKEIDKITQQFLEKVALECYNKKDNTLLMKFVRAFNTIESKRSFLKSLDCAEELLILEEESGNFNEAAEIAKRLGDILREVDLLEKSGDYANVSSLVIFYVLSNSLWLSGSGQGWPLKSFPQKEELLTKAMSVAQKVSGIFHSSICAEANVITTHEQMNLSELMELYNESKRCNTYLGEILSVRKLLDAHLQVHSAKYEWGLELHTDPMLFDERILNNQVSWRTLVYIWNLWKAKVLEILDCLDSLDDGFEVNVRFCLDYFGVRLMNNSNATYILLKPDAAWVGTDKKFIVWNRKVATLDARHFASAAQKYWRQELISTGIKVLEVFQGLHKFFVTKPFSKHSQSLCLTCLYDITRFFLTKSSSLDMKKGDERKLQYFMQLSTEYFNLILPLDPRQSLSEILISLRETEISKKLLEEVISRNISSARNELTHGQIGRVVMIILGSGKPKTDLHTRIAERVGGNSPWKPLIENVNGIMEFHTALEESFYARWRAKECISPHCFFYLMERLLILVPHSQGSFYTTKSSFVEYLMFLQSDANPGSSFVVDNTFYPRNLFQFLTRVVQQCLYNTHETERWIKASRIDLKYYFPVLMLRLIMILCSLCLNSYAPFNVLFQALDVPQIWSQLPREFCQALWRRKNNNNSSYAALIACAFKVIGDPLVIVSSTGARPKVVSPDAIFVDLRSFSCRNEVVKVLVPPVVRNVTESSSTEISPVVSNIQMESTTKSDANLSSENGKGNVQIKWGLIREMSEALESFKKRNNWKLKSLFIKKKVT